LRTIRNYDIVFNNQDSELANHQLVLFLNHMNQLQAKLITAGYKLSEARRLVFSYLEKEHKPISARSLHHKIKKVDRASVYRTLNLLESLELINIEIVNKEKLYCLALKPHHHIICKICGHMETVACTHTFTKIKNFSDIHHQLTLSGVCRQCSKK